MSFPMDEVQTLNSLARQIHEWAIGKKFYMPCELCNHGVPMRLGQVGGTNWVPRDKRPPDFWDKIDRAKKFCEDNPDQWIVCPVCEGRGSEIDQNEFYKQLNHFHGEIDEAFQLTRKHVLEDLIKFTGRPGVVETPGYDTVDPCVPKVPDKHLKAHPALAVEFADIIIRVLDTSRWLGLDIGQAVIDKMAFNNDRPERHGKLH